MTVSVQNAMIGRVKPDMPDDAQVRSVALGVARCAQVPRARLDPAHPCRRIVTLQSDEPAEWQVPEGWAGNLTESRIVFLSSNPSISDAGHYENPLHAEDYPRGSWDDDAIAEFAVHRFGDGDTSPATLDGRLRRMDGQLSPGRVRFWLMVRARAAELIPDARPDRHYAMTEVVHCKSRQEIGVAEAATRCVETHLDPILAMSPAPLVVVLGAKTRDRITDMWDLSAGFGTKAAIGDECRNIAIRTIGSTERVVAYLWHPTGMTAPKTFAGAYPSHLATLTDLTNGRVTVAEAAHSLSHRES
jgi:hypothetical protein